LSSSEFPNNIWTGEPGTGDKPLTRDSVIYTQYLSPLICAKRKWIRASDWERFAGAFGGTETSWIP